MAERAHPRFDLAAQVELTQGDGEVIILTAQNASVGGLFLKGSPKDYPGLTVGSLVSVHICQIQEVTSEDIDMGGSDLVVQATGKIVRIEDGKPPARIGFAVQFTQID